MSFFQFFLEETKPDHDLFNTLLQKYVSNSGKVDYLGFRKDEAKLDEYLTSLGQNFVSKSWSQNEQLAFWINTYNAFTIKLILENYPVNSITDLHKGNPWDVKWIKLGSKTYSLNQIEHEIIRPQFKEPRIHFAVNCAAKSCPPISNIAFTAGNLDSMLESLTRKFINNPDFNSISNRNIEVSKIFEWYGEDFGDLITYLSKYSDLPISSKAKIRFKNYNWALNTK